MHSLHGGDQGQVEEQGDTGADRPQLAPRRPDRPRRRAHMPQLTLATAAPWPEGPDTPCNPGQHYGILGLPEVTMADGPVFPIGSVLDERYELEHLLGRGGGGQVYRARQRSTGQAVAVKILSLGPNLDQHAQERRKARFRREMQICGRLEHPDIVGLIDFGELGDSLYAVFELVPGRTLALLLQAEGSLALARCHSLMRQLLEILIYSHGKGVIHRDLKPSNLMVLGEPGRERIKVLDFGVSALPRGTASTLTPLTLSNEMVGTPAYAAPEQLRGDAPTVKTDLYAWGLILLECLTGTNVMMGASLGETFSRQLSPLPVPIPERLRAHPLGTLLRWVLEKDPARRTGSAADVLARLDAIALDELADAGGYYSDTPGAPAHRPDFLPLTEGLTETAAALLIASERRQVTALCCRLPLRCASSAADATLLDAYQGDLMSLCRSRVEELGGMLVGGVGDLALFYFGLPRAKDTDARMAIRAALELSAHIRARSAALTAQNQVSIGFRAGIHTGLLTAGPRSTGVAFAHDMVAKVATVLALIDRADDEASVTVSDAFRRLAHRHGEFSAPGRVDVSWQADPIVTHQLVGESLSDVFGQETAPLIGRDDQLARLVAAWRESTERGHVALIRGEAGLGKSRLAYELCRIARDRGKSFLTLRFLPQMEHVALGPLLDLMRAELGFNRGQAPTCSGLAEVLRGFEVDLASAVPLLCTWISVPIEAPFAPLPHSPPMQRGMLYALLVELVRQLLARTSSDLLVEDLHWADPSSLDWLGHFIARLAATSGFVLMTARPQLAWRWDVRSPLLIDLQPLDDTEASALIANLPWASRLSPTLIETIVERADGVPLFVEELARAMADVIGPTLTAHVPGDAVPRYIERARSSSSRYALDGAGPDEVPTTLRDLFTSRLDSLGPAKETAQVAAAIGREFEFELLRASLAKNEAGLLSDLDQLMAAGLVVARRHVDHTGYLFRHALLRDAAYASLTDAARQSVHGAIASALLAEFPDRIDARPDLAALHLELAGQPYESQRYWLVAGHKAMRDHAYDEARSLFERGLDTLTHCAEGKARDEADLDLLYALMAAHVVKLGYGAPELGTILDRAQQRIERGLASPARTVPLLWGQYLFNTVRPRFRRALAIAEKLLETATSAGKPAFVLLGHSALIRCAYWMGAFNDVDPSHEAIDAFDDPGLVKQTIAITGEDPYWAGTSFAGLALIVRGEGERGIALLERLTSQRAQLDIPGLTEGTWTQVAFGYLLRGLNEPAGSDLRAARTWGQRARESATRLGFPFWAGYGALMEAAARVYQGEADAVEELEAAGRMFTAAGATIGQGWILDTIAFGLIQRGQLDAAVLALERARQHVAHSDEGFFSAQHARIEARLVQARQPGSSVEVANRLREAVDIARSQGAHLFAEHARADLAALARHGA
jgi:TOMM system kinase/cyclase fusion protein